MEFDTLYDDKIENVSQREGLIYGYLESIALTWNYKIVLLEYICRGTKATNRHFFFPLLFIKDIRNLLKAHKKEWARSKP